MRRKVLAFILRAADRCLLAHSFADAPEVLWRLLGGGVEAGENPAEAVRREVEEETGLTHLQPVRALGVQRYYKAYIQAEVERHDFLFLAPGPLPETWTHTVGGTGADANDTFAFHWLTPNDVTRLDDEHRPWVTPEYVPEFFEGRMI